MMNTKNFLFEIPFLAVAMLPVETGNTTAQINDSIK
jgi:hypothetical protein